ncbi:hypothetical protein [Ewingella americana]|uniref:Uncharacterized protein n=1 Tax=Ewingella americana TaxID=41202 RepID=A0A502GDL5_9GAMM|nr:hypothetical protein [Ewingella americana]TPG59954.1 hypothetical protein EAH77_15415 [Ewingella americana]
MLIQYTKSAVLANNTAANIAADLIGLITQAKTIADCSLACNKDTSSIIGRSPAKAPTLAYHDTAAQIFWLKVDHPLYDNHYTYFGMDYSTPATGLVLKMAEKYDAATKTFSKMTPLSNSNSLVVAPAYTKINTVIEILVSASGILFIGNNESTVTAGALSNLPYAPTGLFVLEAVSSVQGGINAASGVSMFAMGNSYNVPLESTSVYSSGNGLVGGQNALRAANLGTDFASIGGAGPNSGMTARETPTYSHNGALETTFLEFYVFPGDLVYAKIHGVVRPQLKINHARNRTTVKSEEYYGLVLYAANASQALSYATDANNLLQAYVKL